MVRMQKLVLPVAEPIAAASRILVAALKRMALEAEQQLAPVLEMQVPAGVCSAQAVAEMRLLAAEQSRGSAAEKKRELVAVERSPLAARLLPAAAEDNFVLAVPGKPVLAEADSLEAAAAAAGILALAALGILVELVVDIPVAGLLPPVRAWLLSR